jgi:Superinfection immunity protein/Short C-terminal domain
MSDGSSPIAGFVLLVVGFLAYFLPTIIASRRSHPNGNGIALLNIFLGWTFIGWLVALIWSVSAIQKKEAPVVVAPPSDKYQQLERLAALKEKGALSESEFEAEKAKLLS